MAQSEEQSDSRPGVAPRRLVHIMYGLFALGVLSSGVLGAAVLAAVVLAYLKRGELVGTVCASHVDWLLRTFWWGLLWLVISAALTTVFVGFLTGIAAVVWIVYRLAKGWLAHCAGETPLPGL